MRNCGDDLGDVRPHDPFLKIIKIGLRGEAFLTRSRLFPLSLNELFPFAFDLQLEKARFRCHLLVKILDLLLIETCF